MLHLKLSIPRKLLSFSSAPRRKLVYLSMSKPKNQEAGMEHADPGAYVCGLDAAEGWEVEVGEQRVATAVRVQHGVGGGGAVGGAGGGGGREDGRGRGRRGQRRRRNLPAR